MKISFYTLKLNNSNKAFYQSNPIKSQSANPNFKGVNCSEKNFQLKDIKNLHCPVCGLVMLTPEQRKKFIDDVSQKTGEDLIEALTKYEDETALVGDDFKNEHKTIYRPIKEQVIKIIKETAEKNPKLNLLQIVQLKAKEFLEPLIKEQLKITAELEKFLDSADLDDEERRKTSLIIDEYKRQILGESGTEFKRQSYIYDLSNVTPKKDIQDKINEILERLPRSTNDIYSFFVKYSKEADSSKEIASKFVDQSIPTAEHLLPKSKGGKNNTANYICDCAECNSSRHDTDFDLWLKQKPQISKGLQQYVYTVQKVIDEGHFHKSYNNYVEDVIKTINKLSYGKLKLRAPKSTNEEINKAIHNKRAEEVENIKKKVDELRARRNELKAQIKTLESNPQFHNIVQLGIVEKQIETSEKKQANLEEELSSLQKIKQEALDTLTEVTKLHIYLNENNDEEARRKLVDLNETANKKKLSEAEEKIQSLETALNNCESNIAKLLRKSSTLSKLITSTDELEEEIKIQEELMEKCDAVLSKISSLKEKIADENNLNERLKEIKDETEALSEENNIYLENSSSEISKRDFEEYKDKLELLKTGDEILEYIKAPSHKMPSLTTRFVSVSKELLKNRVVELVNQDNVKYFLNLEKIEALEEERANINSRLEEIDEIKAQITEHDKELEDILQDTTLTELRKSLNYLRNQKETIIKIQNISELRVELEIIEDTINYNENILKQLRNFKSMSNEQFQDYISMIFY